MTFDNVPPPLIREDHAAAVGVPRLPHPPSVRNLR
jgi:hypothetical protein